MKNIRSIYPTPRFFSAMLLVASFFVIGHFSGIFLILARILLWLLVFMLLGELLIHFRGKVSCTRSLSERFSNGDPNTVILTLKSYYPVTVFGTILEELPPQFQKRNFRIQCKFSPGTKVQKSYTLVPVTRGRYDFGHTNIMVKVFTGFTARRFKESGSGEVTVYPSYAQLKKMELIAFSASHTIQGTKKLHRPGNNKEFEEIKEYIPGDDYRRINWKATARKNKLMVNQYQDERAQYVYQLIDMGRTMKMPFEGMTLLDYSINSALAIANVILKKEDKTGLITYSDHLHSFVQADNKRTQIHTLLETLYAQQTRFGESNLEHPYLTLSRKAPGRSLLIMYTNFESTLGLERQLPLLQKLAAKHLILLISFKNSEILEEINKPAKHIEDVYFKTIAEKNILDKRSFMKRLTRYGIMNLHVKPEELTISVLNKYLEIKKQGLI